MEKKNVDSESNSQAENVAKRLVLEFLERRTVEAVVQFVDFVAVGPAEPVSLADPCAAHFRHQRRSVFSNTRFVQYYESIPDDQNRHPRAI